MAVGGAVTLEEKLVCSASSAAGAFGDIAVTGRGKAANDLMALVTIDEAQAPPITSSNEISQPPAPNRSRTQINQLPTSISTKWVAEVIRCPASE